METFKIFWGLKLAHLIFSASEQLSTNLQAKNTLVFDGTQGARMLISHFKSLRDELKFNRYYEDILQQSANVTDEPVLPRYRKRPKQLDDGVQSHCYQTPKDRCRHQHLPSKYLWNTMTQSSLNNLLLLYVHSSETDRLDLKDIAQQFISVNDHRLHYFGKIWQCMHCFIINFFL